MGAANRRATINAFMRISTAIFFVFWTTVVLLVPSTGWSWCIEGNGLTHVEKVSSSWSCADVLAVPNADFSGMDLRGSNQHLQNQQYCFDCLDVAAHGDVRKVPTVRATYRAMPTGLAHLPSLALAPGIVSGSISRDEFPTIAGRIDPGFSKTSILLI